MTCRDALPASWTDLLQGGQIGVGMDLATSDATTSNPSSIVISEEYRGLIWERLVISWKTRDEAVTTTLFGLVLADIRSAGKKARAACIDASNEVFFAQRLRKLFSQHCPVYLIKGGEKLRHGSEELQSKELLGSLYVADYAEGRICIPNDTGVKEDRRLVKRVKGQFRTDTDREGRHGDTFDAGKLARWALKRAGRVEAAGARVSGLGSGLNKSRPRPKGILSNTLKRATNA